MEGSPRRKLLAGAAVCVVLALVGSGCRSLPTSSIIAKNNGKRAEDLGIASASSALQSKPNASGWQRPLPAELTPELRAASDWQQAEHVGDTSKNTPIVSISPPSKAKRGPAAVIAAKLPGSEIDVPKEITLPSPRHLPSTTGIPVDEPMIMDHAHGAHPAPPRELAKVAMPPYIIEPPDILLINVRVDLAPGLKITDQHLVTPDGSVRLGPFGAAYVAGMTLDQARVAVANVVNTSGIRGDKATPVDARDVSVDVLAYNSKVYYVVTDGGGYGEQVYRFPITGNETVLDAISNINGLPSVSSKKHIWIARRVPGHGSKQNTLPVDWIGLTQGGGTMTNYQIFPGDRVYVQSDKLIRIDSGLAKILSPIERILGTTLLSSTTYNSIKGRGLSGQGQGF